MYLIQFFAVPGESCPLINNYFLQVSKSLGAGGDMPEHAIQALEARQEAILNKLGQLRYSWLD